MEMRKSNMINIETIKTSLYVNGIKFEENENSLNLKIGKNIYLTVYTSTPYKHLKDYVFFYGYLKHMGSGKIIKRGKKIEKAFLKLESILKYKIRII